jgi:hypothetical protein
MLRVRRAATREAEPEAAARSLAAGAGVPGAAIALVFASPRYPPDAFARALAEAFGPIPVYGCTTAGELGLDGFSEGGAVAMSVASRRFRAGAGLAADLDRSALSSGRRAMLAATEALGRRPEELSASRHVALSLIDGSSHGEEGFIAGAAGSAPGIPFVGGSASYGLQGPPTARVFAGGRAHPNAGLILLMETDHPFTVIMSEHMVPTERRIVVTASDPGRRMVHELDGRPARIVFSEMLGAASAEITDEIAGRNPFGYYVGGRAYVRSVMALEGDSLRFACAVEDGVILRMMRAGEMLETTRRSLLEASERVGGEIRALIAFNCLGRYLETQAAGTTSLMGAELTNHPVIGFNTFGEQINSLHMNHTLAALAIGEKRDA